LLNPFTQQNQQTRGTTGGTAQGTSPITVSDVLMVAGGVTPDADLRNVTIRRMIPRATIPVATAMSTVGSTPFPPGSMVSSTPIPTMTRTEVKVDLWKVIQGGDLTADSRIYDGDEIVIPRIPVNQAEQKTLLTSTIAPGRITVHIAGEVNRPGTVEIAPTARVMDTIAAAGGVNDKANRRSIALFRMSADGKLEQQSVDLEKTTATLRNGDVLVVSKSGADKLFDTLGKVLTPFYPVRAIIDLFRR
jgi:polysaccharide biosynthesis/export protein